MGMSRLISLLMPFFTTFTVPETKTPRKQRHDRVFGEFFIFWYVDMFSSFSL